MWLLFVLLIVLVALIFLKFRKKFKKVSPLGTITVCTGAVKTGKTTLAVALACRAYRKALLSYKIISFFDKSVEKPLLYSNIPLNMEYVPVTTDILLRKVRIAAKSVMFIDEASLVADSQFIKDPVVNLQLMKFFKLYGHYSHGGSMVVDTQSINDLHYAIKRCINKYLYIHDSCKLPFVVLMNVLEQRYSDDGTVVSNQTTDVDDILRHTFVSKKVWRLFDTYCYSILTDDKPLYNAVIDGREHTLKTVNIPSFRNWSDIKENDNDKK